MELVRLVLRGKRQMPSLQTCHVPGSSQAHPIVVKEVRNQLVREALERKNLYKQLQEIFDLFVQIMDAQIALRQEQQQLLEGVGITMLD